MITPPPELVQQWVDEIYKQTECDDARDEHIATQAANWGANQELEACVNWFLQKQIFSKDDVYIPNLRAARRPKPPSLNKQAYDALDTYV